MESEETSLLSENIHPKESLIESPVKLEPASLLGDQGELHKTVVVPDINTVPIVNPKTEPDVVFTPIQPESTVYEDDKTRKMSREDIETMEIMQKEENTKDSTNSWPETPNNEAIENLPINNPILEISTNEDSMASNTTTRSTDPILKQSSTFSSISAADLIEYQWPLDGSGDYYMLQEQVSSFLGITSFKRKYPEIERRKLDPQEVNHLMLNMMISEVQVTLGLTAVKSRDVCDLMMREYPEKYHEYTTVIDEKRKESIKNKHLQYSAPTVEKSQMPNYLKKAMKQVSEYNARLNRQRKDDYGVYYDMQTNVLQYPKRKIKMLAPDLTKPSLYPCSLIPGQFQEYCQKYTSDELNYFPLNSAVYGPPPPAPPDILDQESNSSDIEVEQESMETETADTEKSQGEEDNNKSEKENPSTGVSDPLRKNDENSAKEKIKKEPSTHTTISTVAEVAETKDNGDSDVEKIKEERESPEIDYIDDEKPICGICLKDETSNKKGDPEDLISCSQCDNYGHPSCLDMSKDLVSVIVTYNWQCLECKTCTYCSKPHHEDKMMFCDRCDRGYHTFCVGLRNLPSGLWMCPQCTRSDPDFAKRGGRRGSGGTPRKRKNVDSGGTPGMDTPSKPKRKRRTKKEMEEAREKEKIEKEERLKKRIEKQEEKKKKKKIIIKEIVEDDLSSEEKDEQDDSKQTEETDDDTSKTGTASDVKTEVAVEKPDAPFPKTDSVESNEMAK